MKRFVTSDEHYGHGNIIAFCKRPFRDLHHMHTELVQRHNAVVSYEDEVYHLGDFALDERLVPSVLRRLNGKHFLVSGNHDKCHPCHKKHEKAVRAYLMHGFAGVYEEVWLGDIRMCHLPYSGDSSRVERYSQFRPKDRGEVLLHGHVHEKWKTRERMVNCGVDVWDFAPVTIETALNALTVS